MNVDLIETRKIAGLYGIELCTDLIVALKSGGSLDLWQKIGFSCQDDMKTIIVSLKMPGEVYYASEGRAPGKFPPLQTIADWAKSHHIPQFRDKKTGRWLSYKTRTFLISRKIATLGTKLKAKHYLKAFKLKPELNEKLITAYREDVKNYLQQLFNQ
jgi:hypothetical protein